MRSRSGTDAPVQGVIWRVHSWSGNGSAEPSGAGATFPSGGTGTFLSVHEHPVGENRSGAEVLALRCLAGYLSPTVATAL